MYWAYLPNFTIFYNSELKLSNFVSFNLFTICRERNLATMLDKRLILFSSITGCLSTCWGYHGGFRICFKETERSSQCQGPSHSCSGWSSRPAWTQAFRDDTDNRGGAATTIGESRHTAESTHAFSIVFAFERRKEARSAREYEVRVPAGAQPHLGQDISETTLITGPAAVSTLGRSSHDTLPRRKRSRCAACASRKQKEALSAREIAKAAADGAHQE